MFIYCNNNIFFKLSNLLPVVRVDINPEDIALLVLGVEGDLVDLDNFQARLAGEHRTTAISLKMGDLNLVADVEVDLFRLGFSD